MTLFRATYHTFAAVLRNSVDDWNRLYPSNSYCVLTDTVIAVKFPLCFNSADYDEEFSSSVMGANAYTKKGTTRQPEDKIVRYNMLLHACFP